jgi:Family of unknown function (DUF5677)
LAGAQDDGPEGGRDSWARSVLMGCGLDDASYSVLQGLSAEDLRLGDAGVASFLDPRIAHESEPDGYEVLADIAAAIAVSGQVGEPVRARAQISDALAALLDSGTRQLVVDALNSLDYLIGSCEAEAKRLSEKPTEGDFILVDQARSVILLLMVQACRVCREIHWLLMGGFTAAAWARWRTLHELAVTSAIIVDSRDEGMPARYLAHAATLKARLVRASHVQGFLTDADKARFENGLAAELAKRGSRSSTTERDDYFWTVGERSDKKSSGGFASLERRVGLASFRPFYTVANSNIHADAVSLYEALPGDGGLLINGANSSGFYMPAYLATQSLRIILITVLLGTARRCDSLGRVVNLMDYFMAVIYPAQLTEHCEQLFGLAEDSASRRASTRRQPR